MKSLAILPILFLFMLNSCSTVKVVSDYDKNVNFGSYNSFAFYKPGIDKAKISDLDKKRILRFIDAGLATKGMTKSETPDLLLSFFTKERERIDVYNDYYGYGWGWNPYWYGGYYGNTVSSTTEGTLFIDFIDAKTNELVWQGMGTANLINSSVEKKEARIHEIVNQILAQYPPGSEKK